MKILVVEDESIIAMSAMQEIRRLGHETVGPVLNADDAVSHYHRDKPDRSSWEWRPTLPRP